jgi:phosphatidylglycerophosphate synthase
MHFLIPGLIAFLFFKKNWKKVWAIFILTMLVDVDHLLATPLFSSSRCSINYHPLHSYYAILCYFFLLVPSKTRVIAIALLFHMLTDFIDCFWL